MSVIFLFALVALVLGIGGVIALVLGLVNKKKALWISAIFALLISILALVFALGNAAFKISEFSSKCDHSEFEFEQNPLWEEEYLDEYVEEFEESTEIYSEEIEGTFKSGESTISIYLMPEAQLEELGISVLLIRESREKGKEDDLTVKLNFEKDFQGDLKLEIIDFSNNTIGSDRQSIEADEDDETWIVFELDEDLDIWEVDYFILKTIQNDEQD